MKLITFLTSFLLSLIIAPASIAIEGPTVVAKNTRVVAIYAETQDNHLVQICSGYLYSPNVAFTAAHCLTHEMLKDDEFFIGSPGKPAFSTNLFLVKSWHIHPDYKPVNINDDFGATNDFAILITSKPVASVQTANLADKEFMRDIQKNKSSVSIASYGLTSVKDRMIRDYSRHNIDPRQASFNLISKKYAMKTINSFMKKWGRSYHPDGLYYVRILSNGPSFCDGDSGSGFYHNNTYLGIMNWSAGTNNCGMHNFGSIEKVGSFDPVYKFKPFINKVLDKFI